MSWRIEEYDNNISERSIRIVDEHGNVICDNEPYYPQALRAEHAPLIAAAPDLLKELDVRVGDLVMLRKAIEAGDPRRELFVRIDDMLRETRAAIAKAEPK